MEELLTPIKNNEIEIKRNLIINNIQESFINMKELIYLQDIDNIAIKTFYYEQNMLNSINSIFVREKVANKLVNVANKLEKYGYGLCLYDGWRSYELQLTLYNNYLEKLRKNNPKIKEIEIEKLVTQFVSKPTRDDKFSFLHHTGGAIDLTLTKNGKILDMGTPFDDFSHMAYTNYFEKYSLDDEIRNNRRILYNAMISEDFVNLPSEWWHYDYGDKIWASVKNKDVIYVGEDITKKGRIC